MDVDIVEFVLDQGVVFDYVVVDYYGWFVDQVWCVVGVVVEGDCFDVVFIVGGIDF